jgi:hypothetical protein
MTSSYGYFHHPPSATSSTAATIGSTTFLESERANNGDEIPELDERDLEPSSSFLNTHHDQVAEDNSHNWSLADEHPPENFCNKTPPAFPFEKEETHENEPEQFEGGKQDVSGDFSSYFGSYSGELQSYQFHTDQNETIKESPSKKENKDTRSMSDYFGQSSTENFFLSAPKEEHRQSDLFEPSNYFGDQQHSGSNDPLNFYDQEKLQAQQVPEAEPAQSEHYHYDNFQLPHDQSQQSHENPEVQDEVQENDFTADYSYQDYFGQSTQQSQQSFDYFSSENYTYQAPPILQDESTPKASSNYYDLQTALEATPKAAPSPSPVVCSRCGFMAKDDQMNFCSKCGNQLVDKLKIESIFEGLSISSVASSEKITPVPTPPMPSYQQPTSLLQQQVYSVPKSTPSPAAETYSPPAQQLPSPTSHPIANFGFGGKMYYTFPKQQTRYSSAKSTTINKLTPDVLHISEATPLSSPPLFSLKPKDLKGIILKLQTEKEYNSELLKLFGIILEFGLRPLTNEKSKELLLSDVLKSDNDINYSAIANNSFGYSFRDEFLKGNMKGTLSKALAEEDWLGAYIAAQFLGKEANSQVFSKLASSLDTNDPLRIALLLSSNNQRAIMDIVNEGNWKGMIKVLIALSGYFPIDRIIFSMIERIGDKNIKSFLSILTENVDLSIQDKYLLELYEAILIVHNSSYFNPNLLLDKLVKAEQLAADSTQFDSSKKYLEFINHALNSGIKSVDPQTLARVKSLQERFLVMFGKGGSGSLSFGSEKKGWSGMFYDAVSKFAGMEEESTQVTQNSSTIQHAPPLYPPQQQPIPSYSYDRPGQNEYDYHQEPYVEQKSPERSQPFYPPVSSEAYYAPVQSTTKPVYTPFVSTPPQETSYQPEPVQTENPIYPDSQYSFESQQYDTYPDQYQPAGGQLEGTMTEPQPGYSKFDEFYRTKPQEKEAVTKIEPPQPSFYDLTAPKPQLQTKSINAPEPLLSFEDKAKPAGPTFPISSPPSRHPSISITKPEEPIQKSTVPSGKPFIPMPGIPTPLTTTGRKQPFVPAAQAPSQVESSYSAYSSYTEVSQPEPPQPQMEPVGPQQPPARPKSYYDGGEDDDLGFGNKKIEQTITSSPKKTTEIGPPSGTPGGAGVFGFLKKLNPFSGSSGSEGPSTSPKVTKANLGESNRFYFDPVQKRWIDQKEGEVEQVMSVPPPPIASSAAGVHGASPSSGSIADVSSMGSAPRVPGPPNLEPPSRDSVPTVLKKSKYVNTFHNSNEPTVF